MKPSPRKSESDWLGGCALTGLVFCVILALMVVVNLLADL